jgi:5-methylcytosine-specific restriction enzyme subunit McrC
MVVPLTPEDLAALAPLASKIAVLPTGTPGMFRLAATHWVGSVGLASMQLTLEPKVDRAALVHLMTRGERLSLIDGRYDYGADRVLFLICDLFTAAAERALRTGVLSEYAERDEDLPYVRGRLNLVRIARRQGLVPPVPALHVERTADLPVNRMLASASLTLLRVGVGAVRARRLGHILARLEDAGVPLDAPALLSDRFVVTRMNRHYEPALELARVVLRAEGVNHGAGSTRATSFLVDMNQLFEDYVADVLMRELRPLGFTVRTQVRFHLDRERRIAIRPDVVIYQGAAPVAVVDAKYKRLNGAVAPDNADIFQLAAYCERLGVDLAVLVYPEGAGQTYRLRLPLDTRLHTLTLPLHGNRQAWQASEHRLAQIVAGLMVSREGTSEVATGP